MVAALPLALLLAFLPQDPEPPRFGKTNAEILRMGRANWTQFAAVDRMEGTTAGYVASDSIYGEALRERNDRLLKGKPKYKRAIEGLRKSLFAYSNEFISIGSGITGGGTMWNLTSAAIAPDIEEALYTAFVTSAKPKRMPSSAQIEAAISKATQTVLRKRRQIENNREFSGMSYGACLGALKQVRSLRTEALRLVTPLPKATQAAVRQFLLDGADLGMAE
jgi:hypothetical protein